MSPLKRAVCLALLLCLLIGLSTDFAPVAAQAPDTERVSTDLLQLVNRFSGAGAPAAADNLILSADGTAVLVRIMAKDVSALTPLLEARGFVPVGSEPDFHLVEGYLPLTELVAVTALANEGLLGVMGIHRPVTSVGSVTSEADIVMGAERVRLTTPDNFDGTGIEIGILSDSYDNLSGAATDIASGDLPATITLVQDLASGGSDEGRAMMQLAFDLAPGASYAFATAFGGESVFAANIRNLAGSGVGATQANADVIVDDVVYFAEPFFQDGIIAQAVNDVFNNDGVAYFSSAGNRDTRAYESTDFNGSADTVTGLGAVTAHDFDSTGGTDTRQDITLDTGERIRFATQWDDPFYTVADVDTDIDLYLLDQTGTIVASSTNNSISLQIPYELLDYTNTGATATFELVIVLSTGPAPGRIKYINFGSSTISVDEYDTNSPTVNPHAAAAGAQAVAAAFYGDQRNPESFTSVGPSTFLFDSSGTPLGSAEVRQTPDYTAIDGTNNTFFGSDSEGDGNPNFFGTSAAAPHAAAVAALVRQANPAFTPSQVYSALSNSATDITSSGVGFDNTTGAGLINVWDAIYGVSKTTISTYTNGFEDGFLGQEWTTYSDGPGRVLITGNNTPNTGSFHATFDAFASFGFGLSELILHLDLRGGSNIVLRFDNKESGDEDNPMSTTFTGRENSDGVALSVDGGTTWYELFEFTGTNSTSTYQSQVIDLSNFATTNGLTLGGNVQIKFQQYDNFPFTADGIAIDNVQVSSDTPTSIKLASFASDSPSVKSQAWLLLLLLFLTATTWVAVDFRHEN